MSRRRDEDDRPAVEFVDSRESVDGGEDTLPEVQHRPLSRRWYLLLCAAVLIGAAVLVGNNGHDHHPSAAASNSSAAPGPTGPSRPGLPPEQTFSVALDPAQCPQLTPCPATPGVPESVAAAMLSAFPGSHLGAASTVTVPSGGLWYRQVSATAGTLDIEVRIERPDAPVPMTSHFEPDKAITYARRDEHGFVIQIQVSGPPHDLPHIAVLNDLADDIRLLAQS